MASLSLENNSKSKDKYYKEYSKEDKRVSHKYEFDKSRSDSSRRSHSRTHNDSSQERRDRPSQLEERKILYTENRRISYRSDEKDREPKFQGENEYSSPSRDEQYTNDKSSERDHRLSDHRKPINERLTHNEKYRDRSWSSEKPTDYYKSANDIYSDRHNNAKLIDRCHSRSFDKVSDHRNQIDEKFSSSDRYSGRKTEENNFSRSHVRDEERLPYRDRYDNSRSRERDYRDVSEGITNQQKLNDERSISYKNSSGDEEFIASLLQKIDFLSNQVYQLTQENEILKHSVEQESEDTAAEVTIAFKNKKFEEKFLPTLKELATDLITGRCTVETLNKIIESSDVSHQHSEIYNPEGELFALDISTEEPKESSSVPRYDKSFSEILQSADLVAQEELADSKKESKPFAKTCFNCDGDHFIGECPYPLNHRRIANARKLKRKTFVPSKRYHVCGSQESEFKPGVISDELRNALNLQENQIPLYVYRMRVFGYPPGWLEEASVETSGIALYGSDGTAQADEKGQKDITDVQAKYDPNKLIDFPGFNAPLPPDVVDESSLLGLPPLQMSQLRHVVEQTMPKPEPLPSRKRKLVLPEPKNTKMIRNEENMDVDEDLPPSILEFVPPLPDDTPPPPPPDDASDIAVDESPSDLDSDALPLLNSNSVSGANTPNTAISIIEPFKLMGNLSPHSGSASPSLGELEEIKKKLVIELGITTEPPSPALCDGLASTEEEDNPSITIPSCSLPDHFGSLDNNNELSNVSESSSFSSDSKANSNTPDTLRILRRTDSVGSKLVSLGTPSISRHSSFSKLPNYENFSKDVTTHLNFENLPNSTGTYEKMKKVIKKVKAKINSLVQ